MKVKEGNNGIRTTSKDKEATPRMNPDSKEAVKLRGPRAGDSSKHATLRALNSMRPEDHVGMRPSVLKGLCLLHVGVSFLAKENIGASHQDC